MSNKVDETMDKKPSRRSLLKGALMVLGASVIVQPSGGVLGWAQETPKKEETIKAEVKTNKASIKTAHKTTAHKTTIKESKSKKKPKVSPDTPKKEGSM